MDPRSGVGPSKIRADDSIRARGSRGRGRFPARPTDPEQQQRPDNQRVGLRPADVTALAGKLTAIFKKLGFQYVALDLEGYRQGSLNEVLTKLA